MSICSDIEVPRQAALKMVFEKLRLQHEYILRKAVNSMSNDELAHELNDEYNFVHVLGEGKLKEDWEE